MEIITAEENIKLAYRNLKKNSGSKTAGTDKRTIEYLADLSDEKLVCLVRNKLRHYKPQSVRRVEIPKDNGKTRPLGIPTITDRLIQQCILQVMEPICEAKFRDTSNGFRPNRGVENALAQAERLWTIVNKVDKKSSKIHRKFTYQSIPISHSEKIAYKIRGELKMNKLQLAELERQYDIKRNYYLENDIIKPLWAMYNDKYGVIVDNVRMYDYYIRHGFKILRGHKV